MQCIKMELQAILLQYVEDNWTTGNNMAAQMSL